ncbi:MAG TPA: hypothetical protein VNS88_17515 [Nitrospiraceae bacterium]|nr:hypothetical protein [Nitrospiraceae bacterium]
MRDLNLGPDSRKLIERYRKLDRDQRTIEAKADEIYSLACQMTNTLERWIDIAWCWPDAAPARICGGPHVRVKYQHDRMGQNTRPVEIVEHINHVGEMYPDTPYTIIKEGNA